MSNVWKVIWDSLPPGFRFHPTDEEFVNHYLTNYILCIRDDVDVIPVVDDIFKRDPSELPRLFRGSSIIRSKDPEWWFLSTLKYKSLHSDKFDRSTSKGSWKITGKPKEIHGRGLNRQIAEMRNLVFCENARNEETNWVIHEYCLHDVSWGLTIREQRKYVLCHLVNRQHDYTETSNMEVDPVFEEQQNRFSEEIIQAKIRSLTEGPQTPVATDVSLQNPADHYPTLFSMQEVGPVNHFDEMELEKSMNGGDKYYMLHLLNNVMFSSDEEKSTHSDEFEVTSSSYEQFLESEETSPGTSNQMVLKENRQASPPGTLEGYVDIDETRGFVEDEYQREETRNASSILPPTKYPSASPPEHSVSYIRMIKVETADQRMPVIERPQSTPPWRYLNIKEEKAKVLGNARTDPRSLTPEVRRNPKTEPQTLKPRSGNEKTPITSGEKKRAVDGSRPPFDYLVDLAVGIVLLVLMILWILMC